MGVNARYLRVDQSNRFLKCNKTHSTNPNSHQTAVKAAQTLTATTSSPRLYSHHQQPCPCTVQPSTALCSPVPCVVQTATTQPSLSSSHAAPPPAAPAPDHAAQQPRSPASAPCSQAKACVVVCSTAPAILPHSASNSPVHSQPACTAQSNQQPCNPVCPAATQPKVAPAHMVPVPSPVPVSLSHSQPAQRVTSVLLNGKNFHAWSRSFHSALPWWKNARPVGFWEKEPKPAESDPKFDEWVSDNCFILGWMFNSMEDRVYHMFMYHDTVHGLWTALTQMYAHARNESRIFELYREISHASQTSFGLSVADYFGYLQTRWEELAQYEPLNDFPSDGAVESKRLDRRHTYQFLMGLKSEFEALRTQILNTSPLPSLYEAFAIVDGDERRRRLLLSPSLPESSPIVPDQRAFAATSGNFPDPRGGGRGGGHSGGRGRGTPRTGAIAEVEPIPAALPDFKQLQLQIAQLQSHLGLATASQSSGPTAAIVAETPTALHDELIHPRLPILEPPLSTPPPNGSLPPIASQDPGPRAQAPLPISSPESGISPPLVSDIPPPRSWRPYPLTTPGELSYPDPCQTGGLSWPGIECKPGYDNLLHVTRLDFGTPPNPNCKPAATFPSQIFDLPYLQSVFFFHCFTHTKTTLSVSSNSVINSSLQQLSLRSNPALIGPIPPQISSLESLHILTLSQNRLSGTIPVEVFGLNVFGTIPTTIGQLGMLQKLDLSSNSLFGTIPDTIENLKSLVFIALSNNKFRGKFPKGIGNLQSLQCFIMDDNPMFVSLPEELGLCLSSSEAHGVSVGVGVCGNNQTGSLIHPLEKSQAPPCGFSRSHLLFGTLGFLALQQMLVSI
ncbi:receptor like protein 29 [Actinidia rufa]|uniref:Receptor like protein 29 n=1 Tax=Actinidia rufa TaxID=165716 RepID=A0A7J0G4J7_9ERIC|nr:receptor like protein 29 [Actinidia rufa]